MYAELQTRAIQIGLFTGYCWPAPELPRKKAVVSILRTHFDWPHQSSSEALVPQKSSHAGQQSTALRVPEAPTCDIRRARVLSVDS